MCEVISAATMASMTGIKAAAALTVLDIVSIVGTIGSTLGTFNENQATKDQYAYQSAVENNKAIIRNRQATDTIKRGEELARAKKAKIETLADKQLVSLAGQGGDVTTGSNVDLLAETKELGKLEEERIRGNAAREASAIRAGAEIHRADSVGARHASSTINPLLGAGITAVSGLGSVGQQWYRRGATASSGLGPLRQQGTKD